LTKTLLSPIAIAVRDQTIPGVRAADPERVRAVCGEMLEVNTHKVALASAEMKAVVASIVEGVLSSLAASRTEVIEVMMHAIARFASTREGSDPTVVAAVICDAASVIEVSEEDQHSYLESMIDAVLAACDHLLGSEREELARFLRNALPVFLEKRKSSGTDGAGSA
jgi:hypothetical protein